MSRRFDCLLDKSSKSSNDGFQMYSRRPRREYRQERHIPISLPKKEEKIITEENFPELSSSSKPKKEVVMNFIEKAKITPPEIIPEKKKDIPSPIISNLPFTHQEAQSVFQKIVSNWEQYENQYIEDYGENDYLNKYGSFIHSYKSDTETEESEEKEKEYDYDNFVEY